MAETNVQKNTKTAPNVPTKTEKEVSLKGTLLSVFLLGGFLILTWVGVFILFLARN